MIELKEEIKPKRIRRSKKMLAELAEKKIMEEALLKQKPDNILLSTNNNSLEEQLEFSSEGNIDKNIDNKNNTHPDEETPPAKKRGRKPKGGKIIQEITPLTIKKETKPNVILHLKCSFKDLNEIETSYSSNMSLETRNQNHSGFNSYNISNKSKNSIIDAYNFPIKKTELLYDVYNDTSNFPIGGEEGGPYNKTNINPEENICILPNESREIWRKLKVLEHNLHLNNISDKKSACFWCSYDFDNPAIYIPKHYIKNSYNVYGCFCTPECAVAYLMEENIDSTSKFERYYLINHIYSKIYEYKKNIKPAPNPYYMLDKFYGNLSIQEYRALLRSERLFLIVDKPLTKIMPEFHENNDEFIINNKIIPSSTNYQVKKKINKKSNIINDSFGL